MHQVAHHFIDEVEQALALLREGEANLFLKLGEGLGRLRTKRAERHLATEPEIDVPLDTRHAEGRQRIEFKAIQALSFQSGGGLLRLRRVLAHQGRSMMADHLVEDLARKLYQRGIG